MTLGQLLHNKRMELGRSLEQISASTKIHVKILSALEQDRYSDLPARAFTRGFIVTYCKALRLNHEEVLKNYHDFLESKFTERNDRDLGHQGYVFEGKELEQNKRGLIIGATVAGSFALAVFLVFKPQNHHRNEKHKEFVEEASPSPIESPVQVPFQITSSSTPGALASASSSSSVIPSPSSSVSIIAGTQITTTPAPSATAAAAATATPKATATAAPVIAATPKPTATPAAVVAVTSPTPSASPSPKADKLNKGDDLVGAEITRRVIFEADEDVWVRYQIDEKPVSMLILRKGRQLVIKAKEKLRVQTNLPTALRYKSRSAQYKSLDQAQFSVEADGNIKAIDAGSIAPNALPSSVPPPANP